MSWAHVTRCSSQAFRNGCQSGKPLTRRNTNSCLLYGALITAYALTVQALHLHAEISSPWWVMAVSLPFIEVHLKENDIPGAEFVHKYVKEHTVVQLKRCLHCRSLKTNGIKEDLINRLISLSRPSFFTYYTIVLFSFFLIILTFQSSNYMRNRVWKKRPRLFSMFFKKYSRIKVIFHWRTKFNK